MHQQFLGLMSATVGSWSGQLSFTGIVWKRNPLAGKGVQHDLASIYGASFLGTGRHLVHCEHAAGAGKVSCAAGDGSRAPLITRPVAGSYPIQIL